MQFERAVGAAQVVVGDITDDQANALMSAHRVACDTETTGLDWRADSLALIQFYAPETGPILVQVTHEPPAKALALLESGLVSKVFHHAPFDLRFICSRWNVEPRSIECTKVASKLLSPSAPNGDHSLQALVAKYLDFKVGKGAVRTSNWAAESLTEDQVRYAAGDVVVLLPLADYLRSSLDAVGRSELYRNCCAFLPAHTRLQLGDYPDVFAY